MEGNRRAWTTATLFTSQTSFPMPAGKVHGQRLISGKVLRVEVAIRK